MRVEYINPFVESAVEVLKAYFPETIRRKEIYLKPTSMEIKGVAAMVGLAGDVEGRVLFDMTKNTALGIAVEMTKDFDEKVTVFDEYAKEVIQELSNQITAQAVSRLHDLGFKFDLTPPAIFTGDNMVVSTKFGNVEALVVTMDLGTIGTVEVNVIVRESERRKV